MLKPNRVLDFRPILSLLPREGELRIPNLSHFGISANFAPLPVGVGGERAVSRRLTFRFLGFAKNLLKGRLKGCPVKRLRTLKTSETNFAKTER